MLRLSVTLLQCFHFWRHRHRKEMLAACPCAHGAAPILSVPRHVSQSARHHAATRGATTCWLPRTLQVVGSIAHSHLVQWYAHKQDVRCTHALSATRFAVSQCVSWNVIMFRSVMRCARSPLADGNVRNLTYAQNLSALCHAKPQRHVQI